jgi:hypothetical protein
MRNFTDLKAACGISSLWTTLFKDPAIYLIFLFFTALLVSSNTFAQAVSTGTVPVTPPTGQFAIDGNLKANTPTGGIGDWLPGTGGSGGAVLNATGAPLVAATTFHSVDLFTSGDDIFNGGLKKNDNPNFMTWKNGNPSPAKCDINNLLMHVGDDPTGDTWIILSGDRESTSGNSFISIALLQKMLTKNNNGTFTSLAPNSTGGRSVGDVQISAEFTGGGVNPNLYLEEWKLSGGVYQWVSIAVPANSAFGSTNSDVLTDVPYDAFTSNSYTINSFIEVAFNISAIYRSTSTPCVGSIASMFVMTKSSQAVNADLTDFVTPLQVNLDINVGPPTASGANYCVGQTIANISASGDAGATFNWYTALDANGKPSGTPTAGATYTPSINNTVPGTYNFYVTQLLKGCESQPTTVTIVVNALPIVYTLSGNSICASAPNTGVITLSNSQAGVSYQLKKVSDNSNVQSAQNGTGSQLTWSTLPAGVSYYVLATGAAPTNCTSTTGNASVTEVANPAVYILSGNSICTSAPNTGVITLSNSQAGVSYQLKKVSDNSNVQSAQNGTGSQLTWSTLPAGVSYYVLATGAGPTSCTSTTASASVTGVDNPAIYTLSGNAICSSAPNTGVLTLSNSQVGVSYQLKKVSDNSNEQAPQNGTGSQLTWSSISASVSYYVVATGAAPTNCTSTTGNASVSLSPNPPAPIVAIVNPTCSTSTGTVTVTTPVGSNYEYSYNGAGYQSSPGPFVFAAGAGYSITVRDKTTLCVSDAASCAAEVNNVSNSVKTEAIRSQAESSETYKAVIESQTKVQAAPNPYTDKVKFILESAVSGQASLEIYNMMGQKIQTVFQGYIQAGKSQIKEYNIPKAQRANLVYIFTVGNQKVTGKLIGLH